MQMTDDDKQLLLWAARAAGLQIKPNFYLPEYGLGIIVDPMDCARSWNPLKRDDDALRLAVKLRMQITPGTYNSEELSVFTNPYEIRERYTSLQDAYAATRRAITRAAAEIGKAMGE
jgi:hypothetical protein